MKECPVQMTETTVNVPRQGDDDDDRWLERDGHNTNVLIGGPVLTGQSSAQSPFLIIRAM
jgi:hypothetical protein